MQTRNANKIVALDIRQTHPNKKAYSTDAYYTKLANRLLDDFRRLHLDLDKHATAIMRNAAVLLANYMEDIVADSGQWRSFSDLSQQMFGKPVPMYHNANAEYYPDEPSFEAVRFIVWHAATEMEEFWWDADAQPLRDMAMVAYDRLSNVFEQSPINDELADDITDMLRQASEDFQQMRVALIWIFSDCYLTRSTAAEELIERRMKEADNMVDKMPAESMRWFYAIMHSIFAYKIGPLALKPNEYVAALMRTKSMLREAREIMDIEVLPMAFYQLSIEADGQWLQLLRTNGRKIRVARDEFAIDDEALRKLDGCSAIFVKYLSSWHMNGIMIPVEDMASHWDEFVKDDPDYKAEGTRDATGEMLLKRCGGKEIHYFENIAKLKELLKKNIGYRPEQLGFLNEQDLIGKHPLLFIDKKAQKYAMHFSFAYTPCIADPANPYYDIEVAQEKAISMFWNDQAISTEAILWLLDHDYLPEIYDEPLFCFESSLAEKRSDARFLLRYMRKEHY